MRFRTILTGKVYRKKEPTDYRLNNGTTGKSYKIIFDDYENTEDIKISEEAYNAVNNGDSCLFECEFNSDSERKELKIVRLLAVIKEDRAIEPKEIANIFCNSLAKSVKSSEK